MGRVSANPTPRQIIAAGIQGYIAGEMSACQFHEAPSPTKNATLSALGKVSDDADSIAEYILTGLRDNGYPGWVTTNATRAERKYTDADHEVWCEP